jgi:ATP-binding cassette, subfamily B, bacterial
MRAMPLMPGAAPKNDRAMIRRALHEARPRWGGLAGLLAVALLATPLALLLPIPITLVLDQVLGGKPLGGLLARLVPDGIAESKDSILWLAVIGIVVVAVLVQVQVLITWTLETWLADRLTLGLRARVFRHLQRLSFTYHDTRGSGEALYRVQSDCPAIQNVLVYGLVPMVGAVVKIAVVLAVAASIDWQLTAVAVAAAPVMLVLLAVFRRRLRRQWTVVRERESAAMSVVTETLGALRVVKAFGQEDHEHGRYLARGDESVRAEMSAVRVESTLWLLVGVVLAAGTATVLYLGARHVEAGLLHAGQLIQVLAYLSQLYDPLKTMGSRATGVQKGLASLDRVFALLDTDVDVVERPRARALARAKGDVILDHVAFAYPQGRVVFSDASVTIAAGSRVGIAGPSGSGKSTLLGLLTRFYDPSSGAVLLDGVDLRDYRLADLRAQFAIVLQEPVLFSTSVRENIAYGRPRASIAEIEAAAKAADAHEFILRLPLGYETRVGERGATLSGGERQRISLARAFLKDAPLLLLDEPTSALDTQAEAEVMDAVERLMRGRTTFIVAHRLSTLDGCDVRLRVENGGLVAETSIPR